MSGADWTDIVGAIGGIIGVGLGGTSAVIAGLAKRDSRVSAKAARDSADEAAKVSRIEADRQHDELAPSAPAKIDAKVRSSADLESASLFGSITVLRDYRVVAVGIASTGAEHRIGMPLLLRANQPQGFQIEPWPAGATKPKTREIRFRFWPPIEGDDVSPWTCRCSQPAGENIDGLGHWEWKVPVSYTDVTQNIW